MRVFCCVLSLFCRSGFIAKTYPRPCRFVPHPCGPVPFLCLPKEKEPKERAPRQRRPPGILPCGCVNVGRGSPTAHPCADGERARSIARPCGPFRPPSTGAEGGPERAARIVRAEAKQQQTQPRRSGFCFCAQERAALPPGSPCGPASGWRIRPKGRAHDARAFVAVHGWTVNEPRNPIAQSTGRSPSTGSLGVSFSLVSFSWTSKRKKPARRDAGRKCTDAGRFRERFAPHSTRKL